jgi:etoposide-induced 2.4 mRNA
MSTLLPSALSILCGILHGAKDSLVGITAIRKIHMQNERLNKRNQRHHNQKGSASSSPKQTFSVYQRLAECCCFNIGVFGSSIVIFNWLLLPYMYELMKFIFGHEGRVVRIWSWLNPILLYTFGAFWVLPLFVLSRFVNAFWFQDIAECTFRGRTQSVRSVSFFIADTLFSLIIQALFLIQAVMVGKLLYVGQFASIFHLSLLYSLYSFEYKWFNNGKLERIDMC